MTKRSNPGRMVNRPVLPHRKLGICDRRSGASLTSRLTHTNAHTLSVLSSTTASILVPVKMYVDYDNMR